MAIYNPIESLADENYIWYFINETALTTAYPTASDWQFANVWSTDTIWVWDSNTNSWIDSWSWPDTTDQLPQWIINLYAPNWTQFTGLLDWPYTLNIVQQKLNRFNLNPATNWTFTTTWAIAWDTLTITNNSLTTPVTWPLVTLSPREKWYFIYDGSFWREITRQELYLNWQNQWVKTTDTVTFANLSWTNTWDQDLSWLALKSNVLELDNTTSFTPDADYEPATKKYVDDNAGKVWTKEVDETNIADWKSLVYRTASWKYELEAKPSGWWSWWVETFQDYQWQAVLWLLWKFDVEVAWTLVEAVLISDTLPVGSNVICELRKNNTFSWNVLNATCQITTTESITNTRYKWTPVTSFTSTAIADWDVLYAYLTSIGSTLPAQNVRLILRYS